MAAITPHLELYESTDEELAWAEEDADEAGLGGLGGGGKRKVVDPADITRTRHAGLVRMAMTRQALLEELRLSGLQYRVQFGKPSGAEKAELYLVVGRPDASGNIVPGVPIGSRGPEWNSHLEKLGKGGFKVLAWTSKMDAPSFSLPAGAKELGGACPGAVAGQTTSAKAANFVAMETLVRKKTDYGMRGSEASVWFADAVCQSCYAEGGNYAYSSKQLASMLIFQWTKDAVANGEFVPTMVQAIDRAEYAVDRFYKEHGMRMFRIHDSGDFYSKAYLRAWKQIADHFVPGNPHGYEPVVFWAPTRIWAVAGGIEMVNEINAQPRNLVIRPSAYHINTRAIPGGPQGLGPGWAQGSAVTAAAAIKRAEAYGLYDWNCPAYASENKAHSCTASIGPDDGKGCRACWVRPDESINYKLH